MKGKSIGFRIHDEDLWSEFKRYVLAKHGKLHSALGKEIENAIREYLERRERGEGNTFGHAHVSNSSKRVANEIPELKRAILERVEPGGSIPEKMVEGIVVEISKVADRRAIKNRVNALIADGFLKRDWELGGRVFRVVGREAEKLIGVRQLKE